MTQPKRFIMIGMPATGKTTFLAALWHVVTNADEVPEALTLGVLEGDQEYLNEIRDKWLSYKQVPRTPASSKNLAYMELQGLNGQGAAKVVFPDVSGELFRQQVEDRECEKEYLAEVESASGILLFIHSGDIQRPTKITEIGRLAARIDEQRGAESGEDRREPREWHPSLIPTQVQAVELLQFCMLSQNQGEPLRVAVILSAWDLVQALERTPTQFLGDSLPLLEQFLDAHSERLEHRILGVSAQGGKIEDETSREKLAARTEVQAERIIVRTGDKRTNDITEPIKWLGDSSNAQ